MPGKLYLARENIFPNTLEGIVAIKKGLIAGYMGNPAAAPRVIGCFTDDKLWLYELNYGSSEFLYKMQRHNGFFQGEAYSCRIPKIDSCIDAVGLKKTMEKTNASFFGFAAALLNTKYL